MSIENPRNPKEYRKWLKLKAEEAQLSRSQAYQDALKQYGDNFPALDQAQFAGALISQPGSRPVYLLQAETLDGEVIDPVHCCSSTDVDMNSAVAERTLVGGQIRALLPSVTRLPDAVSQRAAELTYEYRMGAWLPLIVSIKGEARYVLQPFQSCARWGDKTGGMVDPDPAKVTQADISRRPHPSLIFSDQLPYCLLLIRNLS